MNNQELFIIKVKDKAIQGWKVGKILPSVTIAQACLESGWGTSELAIKANNLFGIKAKSGWKGAKYKVKTAEYDKNNNKFYIYADFRKYESWEKSIEDHTNFFTENTWRKENYKNFVGVTDYKKAVKELQKSGYATSQRYADSLLKLIEQYKLYQYDVVALSEKGDRNMKIFLSVGHSILKSGTCTSASGYVNEYRYNKALAPYIKAELEKLGHQCDIIVCPEYQFTRKDQEATYKLPIANSGKYDLVCELHLNASNGAGQGSEAFYYPGDNRGKLIADRFCQSMGKLGFKNRGPKTAQLYMVYQTKPTAVLLENFFCDNKHDTDLANEVGYIAIAKNIAYALTGELPRGEIARAQTVEREEKKKTGWIKENENWYYLKNGNKYSGWLEYNNNWFYFKPKTCEMVTGWLEYNNNKFYFDENGYMVTGQQNINGKIYEFNQDGYLK